MQLLSAHSYADECPPMLEALTDAGCQSK